MKFSKEEISLAKKLHELGVRKEIKEYEYVIGYWTKGWRKDFDHVVGILLNKKLGEIKVGKDALCYPDKIIPLWTWAECANWLEKKGCYCFLTGELKKGGWYCHAYINNNIYEGEGKIREEAILKCMVSVLAERG